MILLLRRLADRLRAWWARLRLFRPRLPLVVPHRLRAPALPRLARRVRVPERTRLRAGHRLRLRFLLRLPRVRDDMTSLPEAALALRLLPERPPAAPPVRLLPPLDLGVARPEHFRIDPETLAGVAERGAPPMRRYREQTRLFEEPVRRPWDREEIELRGWRLVEQADAKAAQMQPSAGEPVPVEQPYEVESAMRHCKEQFQLRRNINRDDFASFEPHEYEPAEALPPGIVSHDSAAFRAELMELEWGLSDVETADMRPHEAMVPLAGAQAQQARAALVSALREVAEQAALSSTPPAR